MTGRSHVLITGASRGIGLGLVREFAARGWIVTATCRDPGAAQALHDLAARADGRVRIEALDVADFGAIDDLARRMATVPIDVLVNNAGVAHRPAEFGDLDYDAWRRVMTVNLMAPMRMTEAFIGSLLLGGQKKVVAISSSLGSISRTWGGDYIYRSSKAAMNMAMRSLARDLSPRGVTVALMSPGYVDTDFTREAASGPPKVSVEESATGLVGAIEAMSPADAGRFYRYTGEDIDW